MNPVQRPSRLLTADEVKAQLARQRENLSQAAQKAIADYAGDKELTDPTDFDNQDFYEDDLETFLPYTGQPQNYKWGCDSVDKAGEWW